MLRPRRAVPTQPQPVPGAGQAKGKPLSEKRRRELSELLIKILLKAVQNDRNPGKPLVGSARLQVDSVTATREELRPDTSFMKLLWSLVEGPSCPLEDEGGHFLLRPGQLWTLIRTIFEPTHFEKSRHSFLINVRIETREQHLLADICHACEAAGARAGADLAQALCFPMPVDAAVDAEDDADDDTEAGGGEEGAREPEDDEDDDAEERDAEEAAAEAEDDEEDAAVDEVAGEGAAAEEAEGAGADAVLHQQRTARVRELLDKLVPFEQATRVVSNVPRTPTTQHGDGGGVGGIGGGGRGIGRGETEGVANGGNDDHAIPRSPVLRPGTIPVGVKRGVLAVCLDAIEKNATPIAGEGAAEFRKHLKKAKGCMEKALAQQAPPPEGALSDNAGLLLGFLGTLTGPQMASAVAGALKQEQLLRTATAAPAAATAAVAATQEGG